MTSQPDDTAPEIIRVDGDELLTTLAALVESVGSLVVGVNALNDRVTRLEQRGRGFR